MAFLGVNFILQKLCQCKKNDNYKVWFGCAMYILVCLFNARTLHKNTIATQTPEQTPLTWGQVHSALCCFSLRKVVIGQFTKMCTLPLIFYQLHYFWRQIFEENIWSLSLSVYIWPLESWTIIAIIRFNSILRMIWGRVEC